MATAGPRPSGFFILPRELRNQVYSYLACFGRSSTTGRGLLLACRQLSDEFLQECCRSIKFNIDNTDPERDRVCRVFKSPILYIARLWHPHYQNTTPKIYIELNATDLPRSSYDTSVVIERELSKLYAAILKARLQTDVRVTIFPRRLTNYFRHIAHNYSTFPEFVRDVKPGYGTAFSIIPTTGDIELSFKLSKVVQGQEITVDDEWVYITTRHSDLSLSLGIYTEAYKARSGN
ncbi:MAG: hypothetical protein M1820_004440 [Bogoriella megaspora]|nr:MAG: hypothetical protein M1820_004440 [Bogoriella megaspora]